MNSSHIPRGAPSGQPGIFGSAVQNPTWPVHSVCRRLRCIAFVDPQHPIVGWKGDRVKANLSRPGPGSQSARPLIVLRTVPSIPAGVFNTDHPPSRQGCVIQPVTPAQPVLEWDGKSGPIFIPFIPHSVSAEVQAEPMGTLRSRKTPTKLADRLIRQAVGASGQQQQKERAFHDGGVQWAGRCGIGVAVIAGGKHPFMRWIGDVVAIPALRARSACWAAGVADQYGPHLRLMRRPR